MLGVGGGADHRHFQHVSGSPRTTLREQQSADFFAFFNIVAVIMIID